MRKEELKLKRIFMIAMAAVTVFLAPVYAENILDTGAIVEDNGYVTGIGEYTYLDPDLPFGVEADGVIDPQHTESNPDQNAIRLGYLFRGDKDAYLLVSPLGVGSRAFGDDVEVGYSPAITGDTGGALSPFNLYGNASAWIKADGYDDIGYLKARATGDLFKINDTTVDLGAENILKVRENADNINRLGITLGAKNVTILGFLPTDWRASWLWHTNPTNGVRDDLVGLNVTSYF